MSRLTQQDAQAVGVWKDDFWKFIYLLMILDRETDADEDVDLVSLGEKVRGVQRKMLDFMLGNRWCYILKSRRMGLTTILAAWFFWRVLFTPNLRVLIIAHTTSTAETIFGIYKRFYDNLPRRLRELFYCDTSNTRELKFFHGAVIKVTSARSDKVAGDGFHIIHATEVAKYPKLVNIIRAAFQAADGRARVVLETSPNGLNEAYDFWRGVGEFRRAANFAKKFFAWFEDDGYQMSVFNPDYTPPPKDPDDLQWEKDYKKEFNLSKPQMNWLRWCLQNKCAGSTTTLDQEYPPSAERAFVLSGRPYFKRHYKDAPKEDEEGVWRFAKPSEFKLYLAGIDTAEGGPKGDFSTVVVVDATDEDDMRVVLHYKKRREIIPFAEDAFAICEEYGAFVTIETKGPGTTVQQYFKDHGYKHMLRRMVPGNVGEDFVEKLGFHTGADNRDMLLSTFQALVHSGKFDPVSPQLKMEMNTFCYSKQGRPDHLPGCHDDSVFGGSLSVQGLPQCGKLYREERFFKHRPRTPAEVVSWEVQTGNLLDRRKHHFRDDRPRGQVRGTSVGRVLASRRSKLR